VGINDDTGVDEAGDVDAVVTPQDEQVGNLHADISVAGTSASHAMRVLTPQSKDSHLTTISTRLTPHGSVPSSQRPIGSRRQPFHQPNPFQAARQEKPRYMRGRETL
jgi:hypothetical protein